MSWVYFIREDVDGGQIKIGHATNPYARMRSMQTGNPRRFVLLGAMKGGRNGERQLHRRFASARTNGEWFESTPELLAFIEGVTRSSEQPVDGGESEWPFTEDQVQWLMGFAQVALASVLMRDNADGASQTTWELRHSDNKTRGVNMCRLALAAMVTCDDVASGLLHQRDGADHAGYEAAYAYFGGEELRRESAEQLRALRSEMANAGDEDEA